jgi:hypothetical protein
MKEEAELLSLVYLILRAALRLLVRGNDQAHDPEIVVLRHQLSILRRQVARPRFKSGDRMLLAASDIAEINVLGWKAAARGHIPEERMAWLDATIGERSPYWVAIANGDNEHLLLVAEDKTRLTGFVHAEASRGTPFCPRVQRPVVPFRGALVLICVKA